MSIFDLFFPEQSQANSLREISAKIADVGVATAYASGASGKNEVHLRYLAEEVDRLKSQNGELSLAVLLLLNIVKNISGLSHSDIADMITELDVSDGKRDGKIDIEVLRKHFSITSLQPKKTVVTNICPACNRKTSNKLATCIYCGWDLA